MKTILVTGANGYIGKNFVALSDREYNIKSISLSSGETPNFENVDTVLHLSALVHPKKTYTEEQFFRVNTQQTTKLATAAKKAGVSHFVFFSTVSVYGVNGFLPHQEKYIDEASPCTPTTPYAKSKYKAESELLKLDDNRFTISVIRSTVVYGKNSPGNISKLRKLVTRLPILPLNHDNVRSMVHIENLVHFTKLVINKQARGIFIPQDAEQLTMKEIIRALSEKLEKPRYLFRLPGAIQGLLLRLHPTLISNLYGNLVFDSSKSNRSLGFKPKISGYDGLKEL